MPITKLHIDEFLTLAQTHTLFDVRSPAEYAHAHIPHAKNLPLFNNEERVVVGTAYKQKNRAEAIKIGLDYFGPKMRAMVEEVEGIVRNWEKGKRNWELGIGDEELGINDSSFKNYNNLKQPNPNPKLPITNYQTVLIHCWRGGMRSAGVAWLLDLYGYKVYTLIGGYKAYRNHVLQQFTKPYHFNIIGGFTGSGKTLVLQALAKNNQAIIDLEGLANHKGSALGALGLPPQPSQEMFENLLASKLSTLNFQPSTINYQPSTQNPQIIWLEDESQRIGNLQIPMPLWATMRQSPVYFLDIPFEERLAYLTQEYGVHKKEELVNAIIRIQKRLGGLETKNAINFLLENNHKESFSILLKYYDKHYKKGLYNRENAAALIKNIVADKVDTDINIILLNNIYHKETK